LGIDSMLEEEEDEKSLGGKGTSLGTVKTGE
jgi:hypothetical protein